MIDKFIGYQIKKHRLEKNMSQESLCSYRIVSIIFSSTAIVCIYFLVIRNKKSIELLFK